MSRDDFWYVSLAKLELYFPKLPSWVDTTQERCAQDLEGRTETVAVYMLEGQCRADTAAAHPGRDDLLARLGSMEQQSGLTALQLPLQHLLRLRAIPGQVLGQLWDEGHPPILQVTISALGKQWEVETRSLSSSQVPLSPVLARCRLLVPF